MTALSPEQCRAARALLDWQQLDLAKHSRVSQKSIADFERGRTTPWARTLEDLRRTFETAGIEFLDEAEGGGGLGVRMRAGFKAVTRSTTGEGRSTPDTGGVDASAWDDDFEAYTADQPTTPYIIPISDTHRAILRQKLTAPEHWNKLSDRAKAVYCRELGLNDSPAQINNQTV